MNLQKFFNTSVGKHIMSAILGFGLATMFRVVCKERNCIIFKAPDFNEIEGKVFNQDNKCYKIETKSIRCRKDVKSVQM